MHRQRRIVRSTALAVSLLAGACTGPSGPPSVDGTVPPAESGATHPAAPKPVAVVPPPPPPPPSVAPPRPAMSPNELMGLERPAVTALLGDPAFRRKDLTAELWRYRAGQCILDLFLYPPPAAPDGIPAVTHVEARARDGATASAGECLNAILAAREDGKAG